MSKTRTLWKQFLDSSFVQVTKVVAPEMMIMCGIICSSHTGSRLLNQAHGYAKERYDYYTFNYDPPEAFMNPEPAHDIAKLEKLTTTKQIKDELDYAFRYRGNFTTTNPKQSAPAGDLVNDIEFFTLIQSLMPPKQPRQFDDEIRIYHVPRPDNKDDNDVRVRFLRIIQANHKLTLCVSDVKEMANYADSLTKSYGKKFDYSALSISIPFSNGAPMADYYQASHMRIYEKDDGEEYDYSKIDMTYATLHSLSDDERKAVLGHEVAHKILHNRGYRPKFPGNAGQRQKEFEADSLSLVMTRNAKAMCSLFGKMNQAEDGPMNHRDAYYQEKLSQAENPTHPTPLARAQRVAALAEKLGMK